VHWGELDVLVVDMPPGTGDVSISLAQLLPRAEALVVTTPQPLAQEVAVRAATMAQKTGMRLLGVVENMTSEVFGAGGGERLAAEIGAPLLGSVPLDAALREAGDAGEPVVLRDPDSVPAQAIVEIARAVDESRSGGFTRTLPLVS
jgi:ATP-binding protein involved in chromosome partitioning